MWHADNLVFNMKEKISEQFSLRSCWETCLTPSCLQKDRTGFMSVFNALLDCWVMECFSGLVSGCRNVVSLNTLLDWL